VTLLTLKEPSFKRSTERRVDTHIPRTEVALSFVVSRPKATAEGVQGSRELGLRQR